MEAPCVQGPRAHGFAIGGSKSPLTRTCESGRLALSDLARAFMSFGRPCGCEPRGRFAFPKRLCGHSNVPLTAHLIRADALTVSDLLILVQRRRTHNRAARVQPGTPYQGPGRPPRTHPRGSEEAGRGRSRPDEAIQPGAPVSRGPADAAHDRQACAPTRP